jgi:hypothetical protein
MSKDKSKLPKWAQEHITELESKLNESKTREAAMRLLIDGSPTIAPDVLPPSEGIKNGWVALRPVDCFGKPKAMKACSSSISHSTWEWDRTRAQGSIAMYSSPSLAIRSLLPQIVEAYVKEMAHALNMIEQYEKEENDRG